MHCFLLDKFNIVKTLFFIRKNIILQKRGHAILCIGTI